MKTIPPSAIAKTAAGVGTVAATVALGMLVKRQRVHPQAARERGHPLLKISD